MKSLNKIFSLEAGMVFSIGSFKLHVEFLLDDRGWLVLLLVVDVEAHGGGGVQAESLLQHLPNPHDGLEVGSISEPHCDLVSPLADIDHSTIHLRTGSFHENDNTNTTPLLLPGKHLGLRVLQ